MPKNTGLFPGGTTSAHAENTQCRPRRPERCGNYLRVRGEYATIAHAPRPLMELPPRARRIPRFASVAGDVPGTTSACAENTLTRNPHSSRNRNYLRVRGEYD